MANINRVVLVGNLTRDPELRQTPSGTSVCGLRIAVNTRRKDSSGQWTEKPNYFDITVWGQQGENCAQYLAKGRPVAIDGRLEWREWDAQDGSKRQAVEVIADTVQFLGSRGEGSGTAAATSSSPPARRAVPTPTFKQPTTTSRSKETLWQHRNQNAPTGRSEEPRPGAAAASRASSASRRSTRSTTRM